MRISPRYLFAVSKMSTPQSVASAVPSHSSNSTQAQKLIFAPAGAKASAQADQYTKGSLDITQLDTSSPLTQFNTWFTHARTSDVHQPETVCLSTASASGAPSSRYVYLKELDSKGFVIYSNLLTSRKAADLKDNPRAALAFWWREVERQVRVEGRVERLTSEESQVYYDTRVRGSRIGAWASEQSKVLQGREELEKRVKDVEQRFEGKDELPVPEFWGGIRVVPDRVEFWQGRESRLHDRFVYVKEGEGWRVERLSP